MAHVLAAILVFVVLRRTPLGGAPDRNIALTLTLAAFFTLLLATSGRTDSNPKAQLVAFSVACVLVGAVYLPGVEIAAAGLAWILIPAILAAAPSSPPVQPYV
jgi:hypothetical protein